MTSMERVFALSRAVEYIVDNGISGSIVECGVWKGGSIMAIAAKLLQLGRTDVDLYLFDTFEGMPAPEDVDRDCDGRGAQEIMEKQERATSKVWAISPEDEVRRNVSSVGYPLERIHFVRGKVEDTLPGNAPDAIALLRLDTDWYASTRHEMEHLYPRLSQGGVLIVDDYGHWNGARKAIDEYFQAASFRPYLSRIDYTGRIAIKP